MTQYGVNPQVMQSVAIEGANLQKRIEADLTSMNEDVHATMGANWTGQARAQYDQVFAACMAEAAKIPAAFAKAVAVINQSNETYVNAEKVNSSIFGG